MDDPSRIADYKLVIALFQEKAEASKRVDMAFRGAMERTLSTQTSYKIQQNGVQLGLI